MRLDTVESSMLHAIGYDREVRMLEVIFNTGQIYFYSDVPSDVYDGLMKAESKGQYFQQAIRDRYKYATLEQWQSVQKDLQKKKQ